MLRQTIFDHIKQAMKDHQPDKLVVLRYIYSEIKNVEIDVKHELSDEEVISLLRKEVKRRKEAIEQYKNGGRLDIADKELAELTIIEAYLPAQMSSADLETIISTTLSQNPTADFGQLMKLVMAATKGQADGKLVSQLVRAKLS